MKKGVTGCQNVRMLRDVESLCMQAEWNYLCGFPGESENDYAPVIRQFPALHHLRPPASASRIVIERFSPYHSGAEPGFPDLRAADQYRITYDLPEPELMDLAYLFTAAPQGVDDTVIDQLRQEADAWTAAYYAGSRFTYCDLGDEVVLVNTRPGFGWRALSVGAPVEVAAFRLLDQPRTADFLAAQLGPLGATPAALADLLARWLELGVVFTDNGSFIQLATEATNQELHRLDTAGLAGARA